MKSKIAVAFPSVSTFIGITVGMLLTVSSSVSGQTTTIPFFLGELNQLSDNASLYLINAPGSAAGDVTLDVDDRIRGHFRIESLEDLSGGGGVYDILNSSVELTAIYDITVVSKVPTGGSTPFGSTYTFVFDPTVGGLDGTPGPAPPTGTMIRFYEDPAKNFSRLLSGGATDDGDPGLTGADLGTGPFASEEALIATGTGGLNFWDLGFTGALGEGWVAVAIDNMLVARGIAPPGNGGTINIAVNILQNYIGPLVQQVGCNLGGPVDVCGSSNVLGVAGADTPFDVFNNVDFAISPVEAVCCVDIEKEINVDGVWFNHDQCTDAPVVSAPHSGEYRLIVSNCGNTVLTNAQINDPTLGIVNVPIADLAPGETRTLADGDIPALGNQEICDQSGEFPNTASITADCTDGDIPTVSDEDSSCLVCEQQEPGACRMTGGNATVSPAIGMDGLDTWTYDFAGLHDTGFWITTGGQINAPSGNHPPSGHWNHTQHGGAEGNFGFHAGTSSAPDGTQISTVECNDPGWCVQARCAPFKQLFWTGVGNFAHQGFEGIFPGCTVVPTRGNVGTLHGVKVMIGDFGENDSPTRRDALVDASTDTCNWFDKLQAAGYAGPPGPFNAADAVFLDSVPDDQFGDKDGQICDKCPDYYQIEIYCGPDLADPANEVIYSFQGFLQHGNYQIHPETGEHCPVTEELVPELFESTTKKGGSKKK